MMTVITAKYKKETTRFTVGCENMAADLATKLKERGYMVKSKTTFEHVERTPEERERATRIVREIYVH